MPFRAARAVFIHANGMWKNGAELTYCFMETFSGTEIQQRKVEDIISQWTDSANIKFKKVQEPRNAIIRITFNSKDQSWSYVGREAMQIDCSRPTMNLQHITEEPISELERHLILHEFGHALGLRHEHQSPARQGALTFSEPLVENYFWEMTPEAMHRDILDQYELNDVSHHSELDFKSVMMYPLPPMTNKENRSIDRNYKLSELDKAYIYISYPYPDFNASNANTKRWSMDKALDVAGVEHQQKMVILKYYRAGDWLEVRREFGLWCAKRFIQF